MSETQLKKNENSDNITSTKLKEQFEEIKNNLEIFQNLKENEKLGKETIDNNKKIYYKVENSQLLWLSRWYYGEGRYKTLEYLDEDFKNFMKFNEELIENMDIDPMSKYNSLAEEVCKFIKSLIEGLNNLKKTYIDFKKMGAKIDNIIISLLDFKDKAKEIKDKKEKASVMLQVTDYVVDKYCKQNQIY